MVWLNWKLFCVSSGLRSESPRGLNFKSWISFVALLRWLHIAFFPQKSVFDNVWLRCLTSNKLLQRLILWSTFLFLKSILKLNIQVSTLWGSSFKAYENTNSKGVFLHQGHAHLSSQYHKVPFYYLSSNHIAIANISNLSSSSLCHQIMDLLAAYNCSFVNGYLYFDSPRE